MGDEHQGRFIALLDHQRLGLDLDPHGAPFAAPAPHRPHLLEDGGEVAGVVSRPPPIEQAQGGDRVQHPSQLPARFLILGPLDTHAHQRRDELKRVRHAVARLGRFGYVRHCLCNSPMRVGRSSGLHANKGDWH